MTSRTEGLGTTLAKREALAAAVDQRRTELRRAVQDLQHVVKSRVDSVKNSVELGHRVAQKPWLWMGGAFGVGLWLGLRRIWID